MKRIKLEFDKRTHPHGSKEHFWHFLLGYLLPSVHFYFKNTNHKIKGSKNDAILLYEDCGPLMNPMIEEITQLLDIPFEIINRIVDWQSVAYDEMIYLPRWDIRLYTSIYFILNKSRYDSNIKIEKKDIKWFINKNFSFRKKALGINLKRDILFVKNLILSKVNNLDKSENQPYLFLDRSDLDSYYAPNGKAQIKGYGKSRRAIVNLDDGCNELNEKGFPAITFQPGSYSLLDQIRTFNNAKGVIGIRGAEFANMIWLTPKSKVFVIGFMEPAFHLYNYACLLDLKLSEQSCASDFPDINDYDIKNILEK